MDRDEMELLHGRGVRRLDAHRIVGDVGERIGRRSGQRVGGQAGLVAGLDRNPSWLRLVSIESSVDGVECVSEIVG